MSWDYAPAAAIVEESLSLFRELGDLNRVADALDRLSGAQLMLGNREDARASAEESLALCEQLGNRRQMMYALGKVGSFAREDGDTARARETYEQVLALAREFEDRWWTAGATGTLAYWALEDGELARAAKLSRESIAIAAELGDRLSLAECFGLIAAIAAIAAAQGKPAVAGQFWGALEKRSSSRASGCIRSGGRGTPLEHMRSRDPSSPPQSSVSGNFLRTMLWPLRWQK